jgi:L-malate glycosyltransferase
MLTVLIATFNGANTLPEVLRAYCRLEPPAGGWNLVIVDDGSTDQTADVVAGFRRRLPVTYVVEPRRGQNVARNRGLASVTGDLLVLSDDDVLPKPDWLRQLRSVADARSDFAIFGGPILPHWQSPPAPWIVDWVPLSVTFAVSSPAAEGSVAPRSLFSPNVAIRAHVFQAGYRFEETIGPNGPDYPMGSETELLVRLEAAHFKAWYCQSAVVEHMIRAFQMNEAWILRRARRFGRGQYRLDLQSIPGHPRAVLGVHKSLLWHLAVLGVGICHARLGGRPEQVFKQRWQWNYLMGQLLEARALHRRGPSRSTEPMADARPSAVRAGRAPLRTDEAR